MCGFRWTAFFWGLLSLAGTFAAQCANPVRVVPNQTNSSGTQTFTDRPLSASAVTVNGTANVTFFHGPGCVDLQPGFTADSSGGAYFHAWVDAAPQAVSVTPASGQGLTQAFTFVASDPNGYSSLSSVWMLVNSALDGTSGCFMYYDTHANLLGLYNDATSQWGYIAPQTTGTLTSSKCTLDGVSSACSSGNQMSVTVGLTFPQNLGGSENTYLAAFDNNNVFSNWLTGGDLDSACPAVLPFNVCQFRRNRDDHTSQRVV